MNSTQVCTDYMLDDTVRELIYKSWHRGCKETDILLGFFARSCLNGMDKISLQLYRKFISEPDWDIYSWLTENSSPPAEYAEMVSTILDYHKKIR